MATTDVTHLRGARVLVGESDPGVRARLRCALEAHGVDVADVSTSSQVLAALVDEGPFDAVVEDVALPGPPCLEVIAMTRGAGLELGFVVIDEASVAEALSPPPDVVHLRHPVDEGAVVTALDQLLAIPHAAAAAKVVFVACAACGRAHISELWPPNPSFCARCVEVAMDADELLDALCDDWLDYDELGWGD